MLKTGPSSSQSERCSSERPIQSPLRVPIISTVCAMAHLPLPGAVEVVGSARGPIVPIRKEHYSGRTMSQDLPTTSYALLGLLTFGDDLTGYELKQRADRTLRFYWVSPAMSQVYTELARLAAARLREPPGTRAPTGGRRSTGSPTKGREALAAWLRERAGGVPDPQAPGRAAAADRSPGRAAATTIALLRATTSTRSPRAGPSWRRCAESLHGRDEPGQPFRHPSLVADWGLEYFDGERAIVEKLLGRLREG